MGKKRQSGIKIDFIGQSAYEVTGSCYQVRYNNHNLLLDFGLYQNNLMVDDYKINHEKIKGLVAKNIDFIFISHANIDHFGKLPLLYKQGCTAQICVPEGNLELMKIMFKDSAKIMASDAEKLANKFNMKATPLYTDDDIGTCLQYIQEYPFDKEFELDDDLKFKFLSAHHIVNSAQIQLTLRDGNAVKHIGYTGDIGSPVIPKYYMRPFKNMDFCDVLIAECTYANAKRNHSLKDRDKDIEKIEAVIWQTCIDGNGKVLIPCFSLDRLESLLSTLYSIYGEDKSFTTKIVVDTPLGIRIAKIWKDIIVSDKEYWDKVFNWKNIVWSEEYTTSKSLQESNESMVVIASSGMCTNGRSVAWCKQLLPNSNNHILFCGYSGSKNTLATKIKDAKANKYITVEGESLPNRCNITVLNSFSSHMCNRELKDYYTDVQYNKIFLVHSNYDDKLIFAKELQELLSKKNRSSKVIVTNKDMTVTI